MAILPNKIFTRRLVLRQIVEKDLRVMVEWSNLAEAYGEYLTPDRLSFEDGLQHLHTGLFGNNQGRTFMIVLVDGTPLGTIHYWLRPEKQDTAIMALKIARVHLRNQGYGTEAQKFLIMFLFDRCGLSNVEMYTDIDNGAQERCLEKLGFSRLDSLQYDDQQVNRTGHLFRLSLADYQKTALYQYHYE